MARLWSCGFELQSTSDGMEWDSTTGSPTIGTTIKHGGAASLRCNVSATTAYITHQYSATSPSVSFRVRFYLYIATPTDALDTIFLARDTATDKLSL